MMSATPIQVVAASDGIVELARDGYLEDVRYGANGLVEQLNVLHSVRRLSGSKARQKVLCF